MRLREIMSTRVVTIRPKEAASEAWTRMRRRRTRHLVVIEDRRLVGVLSERDLGGRSGADIRAGRRVQDLMTPRVASAEPEATVREAADLMRKRLIGSLPVMDGDRLVGIVTAPDVFETLGPAATALRWYVRPRLVALKPSTTALEAARAIEHNNIGAVIVQDRGSVVGIITDRDLAIRVLGRGLDPNTTTLGEVMTTGVATLAPTDTQSDALRLMQRRNVRRIPLVEGERFVGMGRSMICSSTRPRRSIAWPRSYTPRSAREVPRSRPGGGARPGPKRPMGA